MVQISILNGNKAGQYFLTRRFPFHIGRAAHADVSVQGDGVWEDHLEIRFERGSGFHVEAHKGALVSVNGMNVDRAHLCNGDLIELGAIKVRFWLAPTTQRSLGLREAMTWALLAGLLAFELLLIYVLMN